MIQGEGAIVLHDALISWIIEYDNETGHGDITPPHGNRDRVLFAHTQASLDLTGGLDWWSGEHAFVPAITTVVQ
jgi:hypothetical protein